MAVKVKKYARSGYEVIDTVTKRVVDVCHFSQKWDGAAFTGWIARATWTMNTVSDPLYTKRDAVFSAKQMLGYQEND